MTSLHFQRKFNAPQAAPREIREARETSGESVGAGRRRPLLGLVVPSLEQGGGVPSVARFVKDTAERSGLYRLKVISLATSMRDPLHLFLARPGSWIRGVDVEQGEWQGLPFVRVGALFGELEFQRYRPRAALTRELAPCDLTQVVCGSPAWANAVIGLGMPVALQVATRARIERRMREAKLEGIGGRWRKVMTSVTDRMDDYALRAVDAIQVENPWMYEYARQLNEGRDVDLRYAPPGLDADTFCPGRGRELAYDPYILCVGRLDDPRKNIGLLLKAFMLLPAAVRSCLRLLLAGQSGPPKDFWSSADALGLRDRIEFVHRPSRDELVALYQKACVFVLPSDEEGLGVVLLEAMACGVPVVSTRSGGPDGLITDGEDGYLVPLDDAAALADKIARLSLDEGLNREMGRRGRATIEQRYAQEVAGQAFLDVWDRLLRKAGKHTVCAG